MDYGLPDPDPVLEESPIFGGLITRCPHCSTAKYFTSSLLYEAHMLGEHLQLSSSPLVSSTPISPPRDLVFPDLDQSILIEDLDAIIDGDLDVSPVGSLVSLDIPPYMYVDGPFLENIAMPAGDLDE